MAGFKDPALERALAGVLDAFGPAGMSFPLDGDDGTTAGALLECMQAEGLEARVHEPSLYLSVPDRSVLVIDGAEIASRPAAFSRATGANAVSGVPVAATAAGEEAVAGRIAILDGPIAPDDVYAIERRGALAQVYIAAGDDVPDSVSTTVWGVPTHETIGRRPRTPVVSVSRRERERLMRAAQAGRPVSVAAWLVEEWRQCQIPVGDIQGADDAEEFVLVHGGDAPALLAMASALCGCRDDLRRSVRVAWWPARIAGAHAASAWYADAFAAEIDEWCVAHVCVDAGSEARLADATWMAEAAELCLDAMADSGAEGVKGRRPARSGDYSFNQIGVTGLFGGRRFDGDLRAYLTAIARVANAPLHPFDYTAAVLELGAAVQRYQSAAGEAVNLGGVSQDLGALRRAIGAWRSDAEAAIARDPADRDLRRRLNATLRRLARVLVPLGYARGERFDHDPAVRYSALPRLEAALHLATAAAELTPFIRTALDREQNKIRAGIREARRLVTTTSTAATS